ncbi:macro domain-containing protein [Chitinophaga qingshengii]|uniref:Macro domain-containing protein n=1 Tax=Chitinophaga qingshengii TaxID=1569794 RepID=A0ABR7TYT0_9BACT|nr:macro domain-containing protein [Chitinophaga qingshengii]MBC9935005.1 macro domain-containing protein [Chitinophaga qingshengii]
MNHIGYIQGDATQPTGSGNKIIVHICNDVGRWGKGFVLAISARWPEPEQQYRDWFASKKDFVLGKAQLVPVEAGLWVVNVIGQHKIANGKSGTPPIRYEAVQEGLREVYAFATTHQASVHMPRIGCGLAGGSWDKIAPIIEQELTDKGVQVTVYDFN